MIPTVSSMSPVEIAIDRLFETMPHNARFRPLVDLPDNIAGRGNFHCMEYGVIQRALSGPYVIIDAQKFNTEI